MRWTIALASLLALSVASGCASPRPSVHPEFAKYTPTTIYVFDTENRTTRSLEQVKFGGLAQRITGLRVFNFPNLVQVQIREALLSRGYEAVAQASETAPDFSAEAEDKPPYDAFITSSISSWKGSTQPPYRIDMIYKIQLVDAKSGEVLYGGEFGMRGAPEKGRPADTRFIESSVRKSVRKSLRLLPGAN